MSIILCAYKYSYVVGHLLRPIRTFVDAILFSTRNRRKSPKLTSSRLPVVVVFCYLCNDYQAPLVAGLGYVDVLVK